MAIEHDAIVDGERHEPKGISSAGANTVYVANGAGSGSWGKAPYSSTSILVESLNDLPNPVSGVITLAANTNYFLGADLDIGTNTFNVSAGGISFESFNFFGRTLTYTGGATLFTGVDASFSVQNIIIDADGATVFNLTSPVSPNTKNLYCDSVTFIGCDKVGEITDFNAVICTNCAAIGIIDGYQFLTSAGGTWAVVRIQNHGFSSTDASAVFLDLNSTVVSLITLDTLLLNGVTGTVGISGAASNANLPAGALADVVNANFSTDMTPLSGITVDDVRWRFIGNNGVQDTSPGGLVSLNGNATVTSLTGTTPALVSGTWTCDSASHFTCTTAGRFTYNGEADLPVDISVVGTFDPDNNSSLTVYIAKNGSVITNSGISQDIRSADPSSMATIWRTNMSEDDYLEVFIANNEGDADVTGIDVIFRVRG